MSCCNSSVNIGCFDYCGEIVTGFAATQDGEHLFIVYAVNSTVQTFTETLLTGEPLVIPAGKLNEAKDHEIKIKQPDGSLYEFEPNVYCVRLQTVIYTTV